MDLDGARPHAGHERRMARQHTEIAFLAGHDDHLDRARDENPRRRDEFEGDGAGGVHAASAAMRRALSRASSRVPSM